MFIITQNKGDTFQNQEFQIVLYKPQKKILCDSETVNVWKKNFFNSFFFKSPEFLYT